MGATQEELHAAGILEIIEPAGIYVCTRCQATAKVSRSVDHKAGCDAQAAYEAAERKAGGDGR